MGRTRPRGASRAPARKLRLILVGALVAGALSTLESAVASASGSATLYAYPSGTQTSPTSCPPTTTPSSECSLADAITLAEGSTYTGDTVTIVLAAGGYANASNFSIADTNAGSLTLDGSAGAVLCGPLAPSAETACSGLTSVASTTASLVTLGSSSTTPVTFSDITITGGESSGSGGGIWCEDSSESVTLSGSTVSDSSATADGGGINCAGPLTITSSNVDSNTATGAALYGGGVFAPTLTVTDSVISDNTVTPSGTGQATFGGGIASATTLSVSGTTISGNQAVATAGSGTAPAEGGGIFFGSSSSSSATITDSVVETNTVDGEGGGIWVNAGSLQVADSTLSGNQAIIDGEGGAIGEGASGDFVALVDSTLSGNTTTDSSTSSASFNTLGTTSGGGAIFSYGTTSVVDSTIANNSAGDSSGNVAFDGGGGVLNQGTAQVAGSIISANTSAGSGNNCSTVGTVVTDEGYNFSAGSSCGFAAANHGADAATLSLGVLGPNGGPSALVTDTIALQGTGTADAAVGAIAPSALATVASNATGSATIDLCGESTTTSENSFLGVSLASDQRGVARSASACDAGAFEQSSSQTTITSTSPASPVAGTAVNIAVSVGSSSPATAPSGSVTVTASGSDSGTCTASLTSGSGSCSITFDTAGSVSLAAAYAPGDAVASSTSGNVTVASAAPTVTGVSPSSGPAAGGTTVTVSGTNLSGETALDFGTTAASSATCSATSCIAVSPAGTGGATVDVTVTTAGGTSSATSADRFTYESPPAAPTGLVATAGDGSVDLSWSSASGATSYDLYRSTTSGTEGSLVANVTGTTYDDTGLTNGTAYYYEVASVSSAGTGSPSAQVAATPTSPSTPTATPASSSTAGSSSTPAPTVTGISPTSGPAAGGTTITVYGTNLSGEIVVNFGTTAASSAICSTTSCIVASPVGTGGATVDVTVTTAGGTSSATSADRFTYESPSGPPSPPLAPSGAVSFSSGTSASMTGTATAVNAATTVDAAGEGAFTVAQYASDPTTAPSFRSAGEYFDIEVASGSLFSSITVHDCNLNGGAGLEWWTGSTWVAVSPTSAPDGTPSCMTALLSSTSSPTIAQLTGTVFAVRDGTAAPVAPHLVLFSSTARLRRSKIAFAFTCYASTTCAVRGRLTVARRVRVRGHERWEHPAVAIGTVRAAALASGQMRLRVTKFGARVLHRRTRWFRLALVTQFDGATKVHLVFIS